MGEPFGPLVSAAWLRERVGEEDLRVVDLRWYLDGRSGREEYLAGHLPGAAFIDLDRELTAPKGPGRHPIPASDQFQEAMRRAGVGPRTRVVVYDAAGGFSAARLWWLLRYYGHPQAAVLDGGLASWDGPLEAGPALAPRGDFNAAPPDHSMVVDLEQVKAAVGAAIFDARAGDRYRGEVEPIDPKAGHIPGARSLPWRDNLAPDWSFLPPADLRERYALRAGEEVIVYCGSGVSSGVNLLALELAGIRGARLYEGSWSEWSRTDLPVATGPEP